MHTFRDLETAAYCPRKLYYRRREPDVTVPDSVADVRKLAFEYEHLLAVDAALLAAPIEVSPELFRERIHRSAETIDSWSHLADPPRRNTFLEGKDCRGIAHKVIDDPPAPSLVFTGRPPEEGVWEPQSVRLVAAAKALEWERKRSVGHAYAEYPAYGTIREIDVTVRRTGAYRRALRVAESIDGPPPRVANDAKCGPCEFRESCATRTRSLKSMLTP